MNHVKEMNKLYAESLAFKEGCHTSKLDLFMTSLNRIHSKITFTKHVVPILVEKGVCKSYVDLEYKGSKLDRINKIDGALVNEYGIYVYCTNKVRFDENKRSFRITIKDIDEIRRLMKANLDYPSYLFQVNATRTYCVPEEYKIGHYTVPKFEILAIYQAHITLILEVVNKLECNGKFFKRREVRAKDRSYIEISVDEVEEVLDEWNEDLSERWKCNIWTYEDSKVSRAVNMTSKKHKEFPVESAMIFT